MAIPGLKPEFPVRDKVRIGLKNAKGFPQSVDYFICEGVLEGQPKQLRIFFPFQHAEDNFSTGLEWWRGKQLTCYSKGEGNPPLAYRVESMVGGAEVRGEKMGKDRLPITCPVRACPLMKSKDCKPMGRLQFWIDGEDRHAGVFQIDTKSWNTAERLVAVLSTFPDLRGIPFILSVAYVQKGRDRWPELFLEAEVEVNNAKDVEKADALVQLLHVLEVGAEKDAIRSALAAALDHTNAGWRDNPAFIERIKEVGVEQAGRGLLERNGL